MSNLVNDQLYDRARDLADYWAGTLHEKLLVDYVNKKDLEGLYKQVLVSEQAMREREDFNLVMPPEAEGHY